MNKLEIQLEEILKWKKLEKDPKRLARLEKEEKEIRKQLNPEPIKIKNIVKQSN